MIVTMPIHTVSELNQREHWTVRVHRRRAQRAAVVLLLPKDRPPLPVTVTLTRIAPRKIDKHDNYRSCFKAIVDEIAHIYGVKDDDPRITWEYGEQERGEPKEYAVRIEIEGRE